MMSWIAVWLDNVVAVLFTLRGYWNCEVVVFGVGCAVCSDYLCQASWMGRGIPSRCGGRNVRGVRGVFEMFLVAVGFVGICSGVSFA